MTPFKSTGLQQSGLRASSFLVSTSLRTYHGPNTPTQALRFGMGPQIFKKFYSCATENILTGCITAWYKNCSASDHKALQRVVHTAQYITGAELPAIQDLYNRRYQRKALKTVEDSSHPSHRLFSLQVLPEHRICDRNAAEQLPPPSHKTTEQLIKFTLTPSIIYVS